MRTACRDRRPSLCADCVNRIVRYSGGGFSEYCRADGTVIRPRPVFCPNRQKKDLAEEHCPRAG